MVVLDERERLSETGLVEQARFIRSEITDDVLVSAAVSMIIVDILRSLMITSIWLKNLVDRNIASHQEKLRDEGRAEGTAEGIAKVLAVLDEDARKEAERKLRLNGRSED